MFAQSIGHLSQLQPSGTETSMALDAARNQVEVLRAAPVDEVFARFNADPADHPRGASTAAGATFDVERVRQSLATPAVGMIVLPVVGGQLCDDFVDPPWACPVT